MFDEIDLLTKSQLASAMLDRKGPVLVVFKEDDADHFRLFHSFEGFASVPEILRTLAFQFENATYCPGGEED